MSAESNARSYATDFRYWQGNPDATDVENRLRDLAALRAAADELIAETVAEARDHERLTWQAIGDALGTTRQAAQTRYRSNR